MFWHIFRIDVVDLRDLSFTDQASFSGNPINLFFKYAIKTLRIEGKYFLFWCGWEFFSSHAR